MQLRLSLLEKENSIHAWFYWPNDSWLICSPTERGGFCDQCPYVDDLDSLFDKWCTARLQSFKNFALGRHAVCENATAITLNVKDNFSITIEDRCRDILNILKQYPKVSLEDIQIDLLEYIGKL